MTSLFRLLSLIAFIFPVSCLGGIESMDIQGHGEARYLGFIKVYDASLYTYSPASQENILAAETSRCLKLDYAVPLSGDDFIKAADMIMTRQNPPDRLNKIKSEIDRLQKTYRSVSSGDSYTICYSAAKKVTSLALNGQELVSIVLADITSVYFGIWLGPKAPLDETLRDSLLAQTR